MPKMNAQAMTRVPTNPTPSIPKGPNSNLQRFFFPPEGVEGLEFFCAMFRTAYIFSGALTPNNLNPLRNTWATARHKASLA